MGDLKWVVIAAFLIATIALVVSFIGAIVIVYWPYLLAAAAAIIALVIYLKRQKRARNTV